MNQRSHGRQQVFDIAETESKAVTSPDGVSDHRARKSEALDSGEVGQNEHRLSLSRRSAGGKLTEPAMLPPCPSEGRGLDTAVLGYEERLERVTRAKAELVPDPEMKSHYDERCAAYLDLTDRMRDFSARLADR
jgi:hypothetical protein